MLGTSALLTQTATVADGATTTLTCSAGTVINIVTATYMSTTTNCGKIVTSFVAKACQGQTPTCAFTSTPGGDPCPLQAKQLNIFYNCI